MTRIWIYPYTVLTFTSGIQTSKLVLSFKKVLIYQAMYRYSLYINIPTVDTSEYETKTGDRNLIENYIEIWAIFLPFLHSGRNSEHNGFCFIEIHHT